MKRLLLLGGGHAHVHVLAELGRARLPGVEVLLLTPYERQMYSGMVPGLVAGHYRTEQCAITLPPLAQAAGVQMQLGTAVGLDLPRREVLLADGTRLSYDLLSLDTGAVMDRQRLPGAAEHALFVRPIEHFVQQLDALLLRARAQALNVVVVGGGAAGVELSLALQHRLTPKRAAGAAGKPVARGSRVALVTGGTEPLDGYPAGVMARGARALARARITIFRDSCVAVEAQAVVLGSGARLASDATLLATGAEAPAWLRSTGLALDGRGFVLIGPSLQSASHPEVFAVGDVSSRVDAPHPRSGVYAVRAGPPLARNLQLALAGGAAAGALPHYRPPPRTLNLISCGHREAIVSWGPWHTQGRWAWWWKDRIDRGFVDRYSSAAAGGSSAPAANAAQRR